MNEITKLYDNIHMPLDLENRVLNAAPTAHRPKFRPAAILAAVLTVVLLVGCSPQLREMVKTTFPGLDLTIYQKAMKEGGTGMIIAIDTNTSTFAEVREERLFFTGNGEDMDITDQTAEDAPFFYTYTQDEYEITLIVGYAGSIENFGTYEFIKENGAWLTGSGRNFLSNVDEGQAYPWVKVVWDTLDIPWPMPGSIVIDAQ